MPPAALPQGQPSLDGAACSALWQEAGSPQHRLCSPQRSLHCLVGGGRSLCIRPTHSMSNEVKDYHTQSHQWNLF